MIVLDSEAELCVIEQTAPGQRSYSSVNDTSSCPTSRRQNQPEHGEKAYCLSCLPRWRISCLHDRFSQLVRVCLFRLTNLFPSLNISYFRYTFFIPSYYLALYLASIASSRVPPSRRGNGFCGNSQWTTKAGMCEAMSQKRFEWTEGFDLGWTTS